MLTLLVVGFSLKHVLEKKIGTSLAEANSTPSGSNQTTTNEEAIASTSATDPEVYTAHYFMFYSLFIPAHDRLNKSNDCFEWKVISVEGILNVFVAAN